MFVILRILCFRQRKQDKVSNLAKPAFYSSLNFNQRSLMFLDIALKGMRRNKLEHLKLQDWGNQNYILLLLLHIFVTKVFGQFALRTRYGWVTPVLESLFPSSNLQECFISSGKSYLMDIRIQVVQLRLLLLLQIVHQWWWPISQKKMSSRLRSKKIK